MMCHATDSDLLLRGGNRVLSGVRFRGGMRPRRAVFDLPGRLPGGSAGCVPAGGSRAFAEPARESGSRAQTLTSDETAKLQQQTGQDRVQVRVCVPCRPGEGARWSAFTMMRGTAVSVPPSPLPSGRAAFRAGLSGKGMPSALRNAPSLPPSRLLFRVDGLDTSSLHVPEFSQSFRRISQKNAVGGEISTGREFTNTARRFTRTSSIVLVTSEGNVGLSAN